jgi:tetratricopeptide (TPR) repeat protein
MRMGRLTARLIAAFRAWERPAQIAFTSAIVLLLVTLVMLRAGPPELRQPALIGFFGLFFGAQIIFMWANRTMVTPYTQAQRRYLAEDFDGARTILETLHQGGKADVSSLTLLANTYRQLGLLDQSEEVVKRALEIRSFDHFPLYGFGRTLLVKGEYAQASARFREALEAGAPPIVEFDLGEALFRQGAADEARPYLERARLRTSEPFRLLMVDYLLYRMGLGEPPAAALLRAGLPYWRDHAQRFQHTLYGQTLALDVAAMQILLEA